MIKLILVTSTFVAKRSHHFWNYWHVKTLVQGFFISVDERDYNLRVKKTNKQHYAIVGQYQSEMGMQSHRGSLDWNYKLQLTPSLSLKLETLDVSEDGEPEAGSVDCLCKLWVTPLPCSCCVDNAHSCLGRWPPNSPWYLWLIFQKRYSRQNPVLLSEGQEQPHFLLTVDWFTQSVSKYQIQSQHRTHTQSLSLTPSISHAK